MEERKNPPGFPELGLASVLMLARAPGCPPSQQIQCRAGVRAGGAHRHPVECRPPSRPSYLPFARLYDAAGELGGEKLQVGAGSGQVQGR